MTRTINASLRAMLGIAILFAALFALHGTALATGGAGVAFDVKVATAADGRASEFPLNYTINYDNGTSQPILINGEGTFAFTTPGGAVNPVSITYQGAIFALQTRNFHLCLPPNPNGGCWCLCLSWVRVWPWWWIPRFFWYYNPCC